jgi:hypothetical protein
MRRMIGQQARYHSIQPIAEGEEILIDYTAIMETS